ncbi:MAG: type II toxin-antitoxin system mRNA interferase toxin, RelE/StbE family [Candidatus Uhrbacteria bacterium]|nr:type II toxin-antitoxin system mRNA interferase toxin, RelE/StbE family [Candidatus Uhrbacteria bacterium]
MRIAYKKSFDKKFKKLSEKIKQKFYERLAVFIANPFESQLNNHLVDPAYPCCRSINITGDYRALYHEVDDTVTFVIIGTHSELYS